MKHSPYLSIIIPVYNAERYLSACLDSILEQDFTNYEILLIDDGSSDNSGKVCDDYLLRDNRIKVFHKTNGGVSSARNVGIKNAHGEWVYFCDSDDKVLPEGLKLMVSHSYDGEVSMVMGGFKRCTEDGKVNYSVDVDVCNRLDRDQTLLTLFRQSYYYYQGFLWTKLFRYSIIKENHILFNEAISYNEDRLFITQYVCANGNACIYFTKPIYLYFEHDTGAMQSLEQGFNRKFLSDIDAFILMVKLVKSIGASDKVVRNVEYGLGRSCIRILAMMREFEIKDKDLRQRLLSEIKERHLVLMSCYWWTIQISSLIKKKVKSGIEWYNNRLIYH